MLIVGVNTKLTRRCSQSRLADTWWIHLSPVIAQLYDAGGYDVLVSVAVDETDGCASSIIAVRITCRTRCVRKGVGERDHPDVPTARLWIAEDMLRGTLRLPNLPMLRDWPDVIEGFLSAHDSSCADPEASPSLPYLVWKGTR